MHWQGWFTLGVVALVFAVMVRGLRTPDVTLLAGAVVLALAGVIAPADLLHGFSNEGMVTVGALYVVAAGLRETGALDSLGRLVLPGKRSHAPLLPRLCPPVALMSGLLNNTAIVAMLMPIVMDWCRRHRVSPSRLLLPLSYATVLGGTLTLIGTSTSLIVHGLMKAAATKQAAGPFADALHGIGFFEVTAFGVPVVVVGLAYLIIVVARVLPDRQELLEDISVAAREYIVNMRVLPGSPLAGQRVEEAGLRHLAGLFLVEIERQDRVIAPVAPDETLHAGDRLTFAGVRSTIVDLERIRGLVAEDPHADDPPPNKPLERYYTEAVVSATSPLIGVSIRDSNFRAQYNAAVVAVHRGGERLTGRVGDIVLQAGDTLLLQTGPHFVQGHANNPNFYLVSGVRDARPVRRERAWLSLGLLVLLVILMTTEVVPGVVAALAVAGLMVVTQCISGGEARRGVRWNVLLSIAAALALGEALWNSGAAHAIAELAVGVVGRYGPVAALAAVYFTTVLFTETLTHSAAAALVFPLAISVAAELGVSPRPFAMAVLFAASLGFATPIGYQTHLMVYGPGGYRFSDFLKIGLPLDVLMGILAVLLIPRIWPLELAP